LLRRVLRQILAAEQVVPGSHDYKEMVAVFNVLPKDDLFAATPAEIRADIEAVMAAGRTGDVVVSLRPRPTGFSTLVVLPRDRLSGEARQRILETLARRAGGPCLGDHVALLEAALGEGAMRVALGDDRALPDTSALRLYVPGEPLVLSEFVPVLENLGLRALAEDQVVLTPHGAPRLFVQTFFVQDRQG